MTSFFFDRPLIRSAASAVQHRPYLWWLASFIVLASRFAFFNFVPLYHDNGHYLYTSRILAFGMKSLAPFIDTNPPFVMYFGVPAIWISRLLSVNEISGFYLYTLGLTVVVMIITWKQLNMIFEEYELFVRGGLFLVLVNIIMNPPIEYAPLFGQRTHLMFVLLLPYIFLVIMLLSDRPVGGFLAVSIGILACFGVLLAPYFVCSILILEGYLAWKKKSMFFWIRPEFLVFMILICGYVVLMFLYFSEYFHWAKISLETTWVYNFPREKVIQNFLDYSIFLVVAVSVGVFVAPQKHKDFLLVFLMACVSFLIPPMVYRKFFPYHFIPYIFSCLIVIAFSLILVMVRMQDRARWSLGILMLLVIIPVYGYIAALDGIGRYSRRMQDDPIVHMTRRIEQYARGGPVYALTTDLLPIFPAVNNTEVWLAARCHVLWPLPGFIRNRYLGTDREGDGKEHVRLGPMSEEELKFRRMIVNDLIKNRPKLVFVSAGEHHMGFGGLPFDMLGYFNEEKDFRDFWRNFEKLPGEILKEGFRFEAYQAKFLPPDPNP